MKVDYATVNDTLSDGTLSPDAAGPDDYVSTSGTLTFPANTNPTRQIEVQLKDDSVYEGKEHFLVQLSNNFNARIARDTATATIDDDEVKPVLAMTSAGFDVKEGNSDFVENVDVGLSGPTKNPVTFSFATADGAAPTAHSPGDYTETSGTGTIRAGQVLTFIPVTIKGDNRHEQNENFMLTISDQSSNARLGGASTIITIDDND